MQHLQVYVGGVAIKINVTYCLNLVAGELRGEQTFQFDNDSLRRGIPSQRIADNQGPPFFARPRSLRTPPNKQTRAANMFPARFATPFTNVRHTMFTAPEETSEEETERLREENTRLR